MAFITAAKKSIIRKMNRSAGKAGLGDLLGINVAAAGLFTTVGGDATEVITVAGAAAGDIALVTVHTLGTGSRTIVSAAVTTNTLTVTMSGDPAANHVLSYAIIRVV